MLSSAPALISGSTTNPGHMERVTCSSIARIAGVGGESGAGVAGLTTLTAIFGSASVAVMAAATDSCDSAGITRHCTRARARCGRAFSACPPSIIVAVQVVRIWTLVSTTDDSRPTAAGSGGVRRSARMSACTEPLSISARRPKYSLVVSVRWTGNRNAANRFRPAARR